jgi:hypothetical protein
VSVLVYDGIGPFCLANTLNCPNLSKEILNNSVVCSVGAYVNKIRIAFSVDTVPFQSIRQSHITVPSVLSKIGPCHTKTINITIELDTTL